MAADLYETVCKIEYLTGLTIGELLEKLAAGWTLEPPSDKSISLSELKYLCDTVPYNGDE